jgi:hypothetical protein
LVLQLQVSGSVVGLPSAWPPPLWKGTIFIFF